MKMILLAAAAAIAVPAFAQTQSGTNTPDAATPAQPAAPDQTAAPATPADQAAAPATPADTANPAGTTAQDAMSAPTPQGDAAAPMTQSAPAAPATGDPVGGYQPAGPALTGTATPGVTPTFRAAPTPDQAYPAPAPLASYPLCRPGQFDKCRQGSGSTHSRQVHRRHR